MVRIAPRYEVTAGKFKIAGEVEYTAANYGTLDSGAQITGTTEKIGNTRFLFVTSFSF